MTETTPHPSKPKDVEWLEPPAKSRVTPRWRRALRRLTGPAASPIARRRLHHLIARASTPDEITKTICTFSCLGVEIKPLQVPSEVGALIAEARKRSPRTVVEIGTATGGTFCGLAWAAADDATLISVDLRHGEFGGGYPRWRAPLYRSFATRSQRVVLIRGDSHAPATFDAVKAALAGRTIDLLFIDGDHTYEGVREDFITYSKLASSEALIGLHDIVAADERAFPNRGVKSGGVPEFWHELRQSHDCVEIVENWDQGAFGIGLVRDAGSRPLGTADTPPI